MVFAICLIDLIGLAIMEIMTIDSFTEASAIDAKDVTKSNHDGCDAHLLL